MTDRQRRRGSVILLVVGLLTILAMLGSALLISSHLNAKQSRALAQQAPTDPVAAGIVKQIQTILKRDLHLTGTGGNGVYDNARIGVVGATPPWPIGIDIDGNGSIDNESWTDARRWKAFIDMPAVKYIGPPPGPTDPEYDNVDPWLTDSWLASDDLNEPVAGQWSYSYLSDITAELLPEQCRNPRFIPPSADPADWDEPWTLETDPARTGTYTADPDNRRPVDTDGDRIPDAILLDSGVTNGEGQKYYFAVRVTDLSGKLCVNTAGHSGILTSPTSPVNVDLGLYLDGTLGGTGPLFSAINEARATGTDPAADIQNYYDNVASRLLAPNTTTVSYQPFAIGEEMYFRWLGPNAVFDNTRLGVVNRDALIGNTANPLENKLRSLTTYSGSMAVPRLPSSAGSYSTRLNLTNSSALINQADKDFLYDQLLAAGAPAIEAAHFVANLWAYQGGNDVTEAYAFAPNSEVFIVFGLQQPTLRITEAFAKHKKNDDVSALPANDDHFYAYAIELTNVSAGPVDLIDYRIARDGGRVITLPNYTLASGAKAVLYSYGKGDANGQAKEDYFSDGTGPATMGANWHFQNNEVPARNLPIDFSQDASLRIFRAAGTYLVPVDKVSAADLSYTCNDKNAPTDDITENIRRDDDPARGRFNVAKYKKSGFTVDNELGNANTEVLAGDFIGSEHTVSIYQSSTGAVDDLAELSDIFLTGPIDISGSKRPDKLEPFTTRIASASFDPADPRMGLLDLRPNSVMAGADYPDVPWPLILPELVEPLKTDFARTPVDTRIYGKININTATREVLEQLPWPTDVDTNGDGTLNYSITPADYDLIWDYIITYRDRTAIILGDPTYDPIYSPDYSAKREDVCADPTATVTNLRQNSDFDGYLTPGEIAIPLGDFVINKYLFGTIPSTNEFYQSIRDSLYAPISNLVTVNSDVFAVNIRVDLYDADEPPEDTANNPQQTWYYIAVIDRSNCYNDTQTPAVLLFSEVK